MESAPFGGAASAGSAIATAVLVCPTLKGSTLHALSRELGSLPVAVEFVLGLEQRPHGLHAVARRHLQDGLFLLCGRPDIDPNNLANARAELERQGVAAQRVWAAIVDFEQPWTVLEELRGRLSFLGVMPALPHAAVGLPGLTAANTAPSRAAGSTLVGPRIEELSASDLEAVAPQWRRWVRPALRAGALAGLVMVCGGVLGVAASGRWQPSPEPLQLEHPIDPAVAGGAAAKIPWAATPVSEPVRQGTAPELTDETSEEAAAIVVDEPERELAEPELAEPEMSDEGAAIYAALLGQEIRSLDILLVAPVALKRSGRRQVPAKMTFAAADAYCAELEIHGVGSWRLPSAGELSALDGASMLPHAVYWSSTKGDTFGVARVVWNSFKHRMVSMERAWEGGRTLCVRFQRPQDGTPQ